MGAAALVLASIPSEAWLEPNMESTARSRRQWLESEFRRAIKVIREGQLPISRSAKAFVPFAGSQEDSDGYKKLPIFTRAMTDFPASRDLTEDTS